MGMAATRFNTRELALALASALAIGAAAPAPLHAQLDVGTWVRQATPTIPSMTMTIEACCNGGRRLTYHVDMNGTQSLLVIETRLDGHEVPVLMDGRPSGETMAITRVDDHHVSAVVRMNGAPFGTSTSTLSADSRTLTVLNDFSSGSGGQAVGKQTEGWLRQ